MYFSFIVGYAQLLPINLHPPVVSGVKYLHATIQELITISGLSLTIRSLRPVQHCQNAVYSGCSNRYRMSQIGNYYRSVLVEQLLLVISLGIYTNIHTLLATIYRILKRSQKLADSTIVSKNMAIGIDGDIHHERIYFDVIIIMWSISTRWHIWCGM